MGERYDKLAPCKGCKDRKVTLEYNCHSHCERFAEWKIYDRLRAKLEKENTSKVFKRIDWNTCKKF